VNRYVKNREWSDRMTPHVKRIVGPLLLEPASFELDVKEATDLIILHARDKRIAARVRRPGYGRTYPFEFTIRSQLDNGCETELAKIINGFGDWFFYGHGTEQNTIGDWYLIDLNVFRAALIRRVPLSFKKINNGDGTRFIAYDIRSFPPHPSLLISSSGPLPTETQLPLWPGAGP
jgi:hypothetical protein